MKRWLSARIHIPVGKFLLAMAFVAWATSLCTTARAASLPAGSTDSWHVQIFAYGATAPTTFQLTDCRGFGPLPIYSLSAGETLKVVPFMCASGLSVVDAPPVLSFARLTFNDGQTRQSYIVPPVAYGEAFTATPIENEGPVGTWVNAYSAEPSTITWQVFGPDGKEAGRGYFDLGAGWNQFRVPASVPSGTLKLTAGCVGFGPCATKPFLGFVSVSEMTGGNALVLPLK